MRYRVRVAVAAARRELTDDQLLRLLRRLDDATLRLAALDEQVRTEAEATLADAPVSVPAEFEFLSSVARCDPEAAEVLLHPQHAKRLRDLGAKEVRSVRGPGVHRPGDELRLVVDGRPVLLQSTVGILRQKYLADGEDDVGLHRALTRIVGAGERMADQGPLALIVAGAAQAGENAMLAIPWRTFAVPFACLAAGTARFASGRTDRREIIA